MLLRLSTARGRGVSPLQTPLSPPKAQQDSTTTDVTIYEYRIMKKSSLNTSRVCMCQAVTLRAPWGASHCLPQPRLAPSSAAHPAPGLQLGSPSPSLLLQTTHSITEGRLSSVQAPPSLFQHFCTLTAGSNAGWLIFLSHPTTPSFSGSRGLHISIGDLSPFHTAQKTHNQIHEATLHVPRKKEKIALPLVHSPMSQKAKPHQ